MLKKIVPLFICISFLLILPVHADKEYKFTLNKALSNKKITYEWDNHIDNFSFEMVSPSGQLYNSSNYDYIIYDENSNTVSISFNNLEKGQWRVFFRGDSNPVGLSNEIVDYFPEEEPVIPKKEETKESSNNGIIIIGPDGTGTSMEEPEESSEIEEEVNEKIDEEIEENEAEVEEERELTKEELKILEEKQDLYELRAFERESAANSKKEEKRKDEERRIEEELEWEREQTEISLNFSEPIEEEVEEILEEESKEQVIILGNDENETPITVDVETSQKDVDMVNINADEERAKIQERIKKEKRDVMVENIIVVTPLIICIVLFVINILTKRGLIKKK